MARPKAFDRTQALDQALDLFWYRGYEATSIQDLLDTMGLNRGSLYDTFGDKHSLFLEALDRYESQFGGQLGQYLAKPLPIRAAIRLAFEQIIEAAVTDPQRRGCMMVNAIIELAPHDAAVARRAQVATTAGQQAFYTALQTAQANGEIDPSANLEQLAAFLTNTVYGLRVMAKVSPDRARMQAVVDTAMRILA